MIQPCAALTPAFWEGMRFWTKVDFSGECWKWKASKNTDTGYGRYRINGASNFAHRAAYMLNVGPIPPGLTIDHVAARGCKHRSCVNPAHLEVVTREENTSRAPRWNLRKTHCPSGHEYTPENTYRYDRKTGRQCKSCTKKRAMEAWARRKGIEL